VCGGLRFSCDLREDNQQSRMSSEPPKKQTKLLNYFRRSTDSAAVNNDKVYLDLCCICTCSDCRRRLVLVHMQSCSFTLRNVTQQANRIGKLMFMLSNAIDIGILFVCLSGCHVPEIVGGLLNHDISEDL